MRTIGFALAAAVSLAALVACQEAATPAVAAEDEVTQAPSVNPIDLELDVPYVPTREPVVERMLEMAQVGPKDYVIDLGSGDGRIPIAAARKYGAKGFGVDLNPQRIKEANENARQAGVADKVEFRQQDLFKTKIADATVLTMYLLPTVNLQLRPRILSELKPGTRVVSHAFDMEDWEPDADAVVDGSSVFLWIVPAQVAGRWRIRGGGAGDMTLDLTQKYQQVAGTARIGGRDVAIRDGRVRGETLTLVLDTPQGPRIFAARLRNGALTPVAAADAKHPVLTGWKAVKAT